MKFVRPRRIAACSALGEIRKVKCCSDIQSHKKNDQKNLTTVSLRLCIHLCNAPETTNAFIFAYKSAASNHAPPNPSINMSIERF